MSDHLTDIADACDRCQGRGWTLDDQRVIPCCTDLDDLPKWARKGEPACVVAHVTDPSRPRRAACGMLCHGCYGHLEWLIAEMPARWDELAGALVPTAGGGIGRPSRSGGDRLPLIVTDKGNNVGPAADHRNRIIGSLIGWCAVLVEDHGDYKGRVHAARLAVWKDAYLACLPAGDLARPLFAPVRAPREVTVNTTASLLVANLAWIARRPWVTDLLEDMRGLRSRAWSLLNPSHRRSIDVSERTGETCGEPTACDVATRKTTGRCGGMLRARLTDDEWGDEPGSVTCDTCGRVRPLTLIGFADLTENAA